MLRTLLMTVICLGAAQAQSPSAEKPMGLDPRSLGFRDPLVHEPASGDVRVEGASFRVRFDARGTRFEARAEDPRAGHEVAFALREASVGGTPLDVAGGAAPQRAGALIAFERGCALERYEVRSSGIEQSFVFSTLPCRGELVLVIDVETALRGADDGEALRFEGGSHGVAYGKATAIDARGRETAMESTLLENGDIELRVPSAFVEAAELPLVVDPLVSSLQVVAWNPNEIGEIDFAYDAAHDEWLAVFEYDSGAGSFDVFAQRIDGDGTPIGAVVPIDISSNMSWRKPRVAFLPSASKYLVVADVGINNYYPSVYGRLVSFSGGVPSLSSMISIADGGAIFIPGGRSYGGADVGADAGPTAGGRFAVVFSSGSDIALHLVAPDGALVSPLALPIAYSAAYEASPRISKTNGFGDPATQTWAVVYERRASLASNDAQLWMALLDRNGNRRSLLGAQTWALDADLDERSGYDVSSPTDDFGGQRHFLAVQSRVRANEGMNVLGHLFTHQGLGGNPVDLTQLESAYASYRAKNQRYPAVDCDGIRFAVAFQHEYSATDEDVRVSTFARNAAGALVSQEGSASLATATVNEERPAICSRRNGGGVPGRHVVGLRSIENGLHYVKAGIYQGLPAGGIAWRSTGCGDLDFAASGAPGVGMPIEFHLSGVSGIGAMMVGLPISLPVPPCPGCALGTSGIAVFYASDWSVVLPNDFALIGATFAVQGFDVVSRGACLGAVRMSDTADIAIR